MSKIVRVKYINLDKKVVEEVCYLIEDNDTIVPKITTFDVSLLFPNNKFLTTQTTIENDSTFDVSSLLPNDDTIVLEDSTGLWFLDRKNLISMVPATDLELSDYLNRN